MSVLLSRFFMSSLDSDSSSTLACSPWLTVCSSSFIDCISSLEVVSSSLVLCNSSLVDWSSSLVAFSSSCEVCISSRVVCTSSRECWSSCASAVTRALWTLTRSALPDAFGTRGADTSLKTINTIPRSGSGSASPWTVTSTTCVPPLVPTLTFWTVTSASFNATLSPSRAMANTFRVALPAGGSRYFPVFPLK